MKNTNKSFKTEKI